MSAIDRIQVSAPFTTAAIHEALVYKVVRGGFLEALRTFLKNVQLEWAEVNTACAFRRNGLPVIQLGKTFFTREVKDENEAADLVLHELMHHILRHLFVSSGLLSQGYSLQLQNLAMDAIINAYLASFGCAGFMERYYPDRDEYAFLRPRSTLFEVQSGLLFKSYKPVHKVSTEKSREFYAFYKKLYDLEISLEESLKFFQKYFPVPAGELPWLGGHGDAGKPAEEEGNTAGSGDLFDEYEANRILNKLLIKELPVSRSTSANFAEIAKRVALNLTQAGATKAERRISRRFPAKLGRSDLVQIETDRFLFKRSDYRLREVWLLLDISSSMDKYLPFMINLINTLSRAGLKIRVVCWASRAMEVPYSQILEGKLPGRVGRGGTDGEQLAVYMANEKIEQAVIITDNAAGQIGTRITARLQLCLVEGANHSGSFLDKRTVPNCTTHQLKL